MKDSVVDNLLFGRVHAEVRVVEVSAVAPVVNEDQAAGVSLDVAFQREGVEVTALKQRILHWIARVSLLGTGHEHRQFTITNGPVARVGHLPFLSKSVNRLCGECEH